MNANILAWLVSTGLDEQRAQIYVVTLSQGEASAKEIADELGMNRTAVYDNLRVLEERGYVTTIHQGKRKVFVPLHPKELYKRIENQKQQLKDLLPDFLSIYADESKRPFVQMFTGIHAAREVFDDILATTKKEYVYFSPQQLTLSMIGTTYMKQWIEKRVKKGIHTKSLRVKGREIPSEQIFNGEEKYLRQIRHLPAYVDLQSSIYIYEHNIGVISTQREGAAFIIHSPDLAYSFRQIFDFMWSVSMKS